MKTNNLRQTKGITLIALIVTIIILLILAGISISAISGDGLFSRARGAASQYEIAAQQESISLAMYDYTIANLERNSGYMGGNLSSNDMQDLANYYDGLGYEYVYLQSAEVGEVRDDGGTTWIALHLKKKRSDTVEFVITRTGNILNTSEGEIEKSVLIADANTANNGNNGGSSTPTTPPAPTYTVYSLGQEVSVGGESFYVIEENDTSSKSDISLLSKYCIDDDNEQFMYSIKTYYFCTDNNNTETGYWVNINGITYPYELEGVESDRATVYNKAKAYGISKGGTGRLLTKSEADNLLQSNKIPDIIYGKCNVYGAQSALQYWLGTAYNENIVWSVNGFYEKVLGDEEWVSEEEPDNSVSMSRLGGSSFTYKSGVRPVITVSKSLIS